MKGNIFFKVYKNKKIIAVIPARKDSKRIKNKNLLNLDGVPLISYSIHYAKKSNLIDRVFVSTDGSKIASVSKKFGAEVIIRPKKLCDDIIMPDFAVIHAVEYIKNNLKYDFDYVVFLQPTTPLRKKGELDKAIKYCVSRKFDTVFSSINYKPFLWRKKKNNLIPISFNPYRRKRSQEIININETGSFYITKKDSYLKYRNRFGKKVSSFNADFHSFFEIDTLKEYQYLLKILKTSIPRKHGICLPKK